jgi:hypothetical protein
MPSERDAAPDAAGVRHISLSPADRISSHSRSSRGGRSRPIPGSSHGRNSIRKTRQRNFAAGPSKFKVALINREHAGWHFIRELPLLRGYSESPMTLKMSSETGAMSHDSVTAPAFPDRFSAIGSHCSTCALLRLGLDRL